MRPAVMGSYPPQDEKAGGSEMSTPPTCSYSVRTQLCHSSYWIWNRHMAQGPEPHCSVGCFLKRQPLSRGGQVDVNKVYGMNKWTDCTMRYLGWEKKKKEATYPLAYVPIDQFFSWHLIYWAPYLSTTPQTSYSTHSWFFWRFPQSLLLQTF